MLGYIAEEMIGLQIPPELHDAAEVATRAAEIGVEPSFRAVVGQAAQGKDAAMDKRDEGWAPGAGAGAGHGHRDAWAGR